MQTSITFDHNKIISNLSQLAMNDCMVVLIANNLKVTIWLPIGLKFDLQATHISDMV